jgi:hypothetical protein
VYLGEFVDLGFVGVVNVTQQVDLVDDEYHGQVVSVGELNLVVHVVLPLLRALCVTHNALGSDTAIGARVLALAAVVWSYLE